MSKFLRVKCKCGNEQNIFAHASKAVCCLVCGERMASPTGSRVKVAEGCKVLKAL
jgi:small subunit ribosomal protein S27e